MFPGNDLLTRHFIVEKPEYANADQGITDDDILF